VDGVPVVFQCSFLAPELRELVRDYTPEQSLYALIRERTGRVPVSASETLRAHSLPGHVAAVLDLPENAPGWLSRRITLDAAGRPLLFDEAHFAAERVELRVERRGAQATLHYAVVTGPPGTRRPAPAP
ncbi:MAG TPA: UTRA domain-containing protein, partial [Armatimonadota bacterium]|nr:UTRA domain-containing protein [Armatimonadota bacterium]